MHRREVSKFVKVLIFFLIYTVVYIIVSYVMKPSPIYNFVSDEIRVGDQYVFMYLKAEEPQFSDLDGAKVFQKRQCGKCFITNNKGFIPFDEYDAILEHGDKEVLMETSAVMDPGKRYVIETPRSCLMKKLVGCEEEPILTSFATKDEFVLCNLCRHLHATRAVKSGFHKK